MYKGKKLLVLGGIQRCCEIVSIAKKMGAYVIVLDYYENSPAKALADEKVLLDATDVNAIVSYCRENHVNGVTTGFVDILMPVCYEVCKRLKLPYYATPKMISMSTNKNVFKEVCEKNGLLTPKTYYVGNEIPLSLQNTISFPAFVKPLDSSGSKGAGVCNNYIELKSRFENAIKLSPSNKAIIEEYIVGREFLLNYVAQNGEYRLISMFDRYMSSDRGTAINYSNISMAPSKAIDYYLDAINEKVINMFSREGFSNGILFMQGFFDGNRIVFYEMGCRLGGSYYLLEEAVSNINTVKMVINYALTGEMVNNFELIPYDIAKYERYALACNYLLKGDDETIARITGLQEMKMIKSYVSSILYKGVGSHYGKDSIVDKPVLSVFLLENNLIEAKRSVNMLNEIINVYNFDGVSLLMEKYDGNELQ